jgi:hypothetical protein
VASNPSGFLGCSSIFSYFWDIFCQPKQKSIKIPENSLNFESRRENHFWVAPGIEKSSITIILKSDGISGHPHNPSKKNQQQKKPKKLIRAQI